MYFMKLFMYWLYIGIIFLMSFIPGFAIANGLKTLNTVEKLAVSFGFSFIIIAAMIPIMAFNQFLLAQIIFIFIIIVSLLYLFKVKSKLRFEADAIFIISVFIISLISRFYLQTLWEYPTLGGDWFYHTFMVPYGFEEGNWLPPIARPPLFNLLIYSYHNLLDTSLYQYWISQITSVVINSAYIFPAYLIAKEAFGDWVAKVSALFMLVTPFLIFNTIYTWSKPTAMYCVLMMIYFLFFCQHEIRLRYTLAGFFAGLGFWFHNLVVFYIGIAVILLIYKGKMYEKPQKIFDILKRLSYFFLILLIFLAPYFIWMYSYYGVSLISKFIYYPFAVKGFDSAIHGDKQELFNTFYSTPIKEIIMVRLSNAIVTLTPATPPYEIGSGIFPTYNSIFYYTSDYPGALSTLMYFLVVVWFVRYILGKERTDWILVSFFVFPLIINLIMYGWKETGLVFGILHSTVPILIMLGINELYCNHFLTKVKAILCYLIFIGAIIEDVLFAIIIKNFYVLEGTRNLLDNVGRTKVAFDFDISNFVSAYFLFDTQFEKILNLIISIVIIIIIAFYMKKMEIK